MTHISSRPVLTLPSRLHIGLPRGLFTVRLPLKFFKTLLPYSILAIFPIHLNPLDLIILTILWEWYKIHINVSPSEAISIPYSEHTHTNILRRARLYVSGKELFSKL